MHRYSLIIIVFGASRRGFGVEYGVYRGVMHISIECYLHMEFPLLFYMVYLELLFLHPGFLFHV